MTLAGKGAVVTGATRGIGAAVARAFDDLGARTVLVARDARALDAVVATLKHAVPFAADLAEPEAATRIVDASSRLLGDAPEVLVNNAGVFHLASIEDTDDAALEAELDVNLAAPFRLLRALLPRMRERRAGHVVTIGSIADRLTLPGNGAYAAAKFGARALHEVARAELRGSGVRASLVSPGPTDTPLWDPHDPDSRDDLTSRAMMLTPDAVARAVVFVVTQPPDVNIDELRLSRA